MLCDPEISSPLEIMHRTWLNSLVVHVFSVHKQSLILLPGLRAVANGARGHAAASVHGVPGGGEVHMEMDMVSLGVQFRILFPRSKASTLDTHCCCSFALAAL